MKTLLILLIIKRFKKYEFTKSQILSKFSSMQTEFAFPCPMINFNMNVVFHERRTSGDLHFAGRQNDIFWWCHHRMLPPVPVVYNIELINNRKLN